MEPSEKPTSRSEINLAPIYGVLGIFCLGGYVAIMKSPEAALLIMGCVFAFLCIVGLAVQE